MGRRRESGHAFVEFAIVAALLMVAGVLLARFHPAFLGLVVLGAGVWLAPTVLEWRDRIRHWRAQLAHAERAEERWRALLASGFEAAASVRGRRGEGGAYLAVDTRADRLALVTGAETAEFELARLQRVELFRITVSRFGEADRYRYGLALSGVDLPRNLGLSFPSRREGRRAFETLRGALGSRVTFDDTAAR
jgi:hypothetical protein